jgi:hypothetical protein
MKKPTYLQLFIGIFLFFAVLHFLANTYIAGSFVWLMPAETVDLRVTHLFGTLIFYFLNILFSPVISLFIKSIFELIDSSNL